MVCSPHRNQLAGIGYLATINAYRDMPIATPQFQASYSRATPPQFGYQNQFAPSDISDKVSQYKQFQEDSKTYQIQRIYIKEYITQKDAPIIYLPNDPNNQNNVAGIQPQNGQRENSQRNLDNIIHRLTKPNASTQNTATQDNTSVPYRSEIEYIPQQTRQPVQNDAQQNPNHQTKQHQIPNHQPELDLRDKIKDSLQSILQKQSLEQEQQKQTNMSNQNSTNESQNQLKPMRGLLYV